MKHLITILCLLLPIAVQAQIIDTDFNIGDYFVHVLAFPDTGLISLKTQPYKQ